MTMSAPAFDILDDDDGFARNGIELPDSLTVPQSWKKLLEQSMEGTILVIGATDVGKSTLARFLYHKWISSGKKVAFLDGDPGQSSLGPPTTLTLFYQDEEEGKRCAVARYFIGSTTPRGHMLPMLVGGAYLINLARKRNRHTILYDTSGLVDAAQGGLALKLAKVQLHQPEAIIAIQRTDELAPLLVPLQRSRRTKVIVLKPASAAVARSQQERRLHRQQIFNRYFQSAILLDLNWTDFAVFPLPWFRIHGLLAFEDRLGSCLALGIITQIDRLNRTLQVKTPLRKLEGVAALHLGRLLVHPITYEDQQI